MYVISFIPPLNTLVVQPLAIYASFVPYGTARTQFEDMPLNAFEPKVNGTKISDFTSFRPEQL